MIIFSITKNCQNVVTSAVLVQNDLSDEEPVRDDGRSAIQHDGGVLSRTHRPTSGLALRHLAIACAERPLQTYGQLEWY